MKKINCRSKLGVDPAFRKALLANPAATIQPYLDAGDITQSEADTLVKMIEGGWEPPYNHIDLDCEGVDINPST
jgi:hypothetical protein